MKLDSLNIYYISAVSSGTATQRTALQEVFSHLSKKHKVMTEHIARDDVLEWEKQQTHALSVPRRDFAWVNDSDVAIANLTLPTTGGGEELEYSLDVLQIPVLALVEQGAKIPKMVTEHKHPLLTAKFYSTVEEQNTLTEKFLANNAPEFALHDKYIGWCGIDGSGKGVMNEAFLTVMEEKGLRVFDAINYMKKHNALPVWEDIRSTTDALLVCEPTTEGLGRLIREDMINKDNPWSSRSVSAAYSLNRQKLLSSLVLPALAEGVWVGTDRHEISSEHYQPLHGEMWGGESKEVLQGYVRGLEGNKLALANPPGLFILAHAPAEVALERLLARSKQDDAGYEEIEFMTALAQRYANKDLRTPYIRRGTLFVDFEYVDQKRPRTLERALDLFRRYVG